MSTYPCCQHCPGDITHEINEVDEHDEPCDLCEALLRHLERAELIAALEAVTAERDARRDEVMALQAALFDSGYREAEFRAENAALAAAVTRVRALVPDMQANGNSRALGDPRAETWHEAARLVLDALDGTP